MIVFIIKFPFLFDPKIKGVLISDIMCVNKICMIVIQCLI